MIAGTMVCEAVDLDSAIAKAATFLRRGSAVLLSFDLRVRPGEPQLGRVVTQG